MIVIKKLTLNHTAADGALGESIQIHQFTQLEWHRVNARLTLLLQLCYQSKFEHGDNWEREKWKRFTITFVVNYVDVLMPTVEVVVQLFVTRLSWTNVFIFSFFWCLWLKQFFITSFSNARTTFSATYFFSRTCNWRFSSALSFVWCFFKLVLQYELCYQSAKIARALIVEKT